MNARGFPSLPTVCRCAHCGTPIRYGTDTSRFPGDRGRYHPDCVEPARRAALIKLRRALAEDDLLPSERRDVTKSIRELEG